MMPTFSTIVGVPQSPCNEIIIQLACLHRVIVQCPAAGIMHMRSACELLMTCQNDVQCCNLADIFRLASTRRDVSSSKLLMLCQVLAQPQQLRLLPQLSTAVQKLLPSCQIRLQIHHYSLGLPGFWSPALSVSSLLRDDLTLLAGSRHGLPILGLTVLLTMMHFVWQGKSVMQGLKILRRTPGPFGDHHAGRLVMLLFGRGRDPCVLKRMACL